MQLKPRTRLIIGLLCLLALAALWGWLQRQPAVSPSSEAPPADGREAARPTQTPVRSPAQLPQLGGVRPAAAKPASASATNVPAEPFPYRLHNTARRLDDLMRDDAAILLRNALIDSRQPLNLAIPAHLRAGAEPGAYVVQSRGPSSDGFRRLLSDAGATVVSYVPNNAWLVRASAAGARQLAALPVTQAVVPWEPYYKLEPGLLAAAVEQRFLPTPAAFNVLVFPDGRDEAAQAIRALGAYVHAEERSPFGTQFTVYAPETSLVSLAQLPVVQAIERHAHRRPANDLSRARVKVSPNPTAAPNYLNLDGTGVRVAVNDTGVDASHPDLSPRVTSPLQGTLTDPQGHGTHVAGIIASSGQNGPNGGNVQGSFTNSNYRGMASEAGIYALPIDLVFGPTISDEYLQRQTALTNILISNNSWSYVGVEDYNFAAANWDAAVRDALPGVTGPQPQLVVFAAGNSGDGDDAGEGGRPDSVNSPGTAKNVITVGAIENLRRITNEVTIAGDTGAPWFGSTDSSNQVASFSSRGNVGRGQEGIYGRFKPDLVAPGTMVVSTRSGQWQDPTGQTTPDVNDYRDLTIAARRTNTYLLYVPPNGIQLTILTLTNEASPTPFPPLLIYAALNQPPGSGDFKGVNAATFPVTEGDWFYRIVNTNAIDVHFDLRTILILTNDTGNYYPVLKDLNDTVGPNYRFESGTSQSAAVVSGMLALMQQHFQQTLGGTNSPALMKALLINGARTVRTADPNYGFGVRDIINYQGWGLPNLTNVLPASLATGDTGNGALVYFDQAPDRALATGESYTRTVTVDTAGLNSALRFTLVWTDPPGNPAVAVKLVNDLDLIVSNRTTGAVFVGNAIDAGSLFNTAVESNAVPDFDLVNNVENVFLDRPLSGGTYEVTVRARRVNVNAVTTQTNGTRQDFALVISSGNPGAQARLTMSAPNAGWDPAPRVRPVINGLAVLNQRVGANDPLLLSTNGITNQWNFYIVTNKIEGTNAGYASNIAFATFLPPNLSRPRYFTADIDLYVSLNPNLTNLDPAVIASSYRSVKRGGTEMIVLSNVIDGDIYYAGVKSEDQQGASYGFFAISSEQPFTSQDTNGNIVFLGYPMGVDVPDGDASEPGGTNVFGFCTEQGEIQNVVVTNTLTAELGGDLAGNLAHDTDFTVLNNHRSFIGTETSVYDESESGDIPIAIPPDGPGSLRSFVGNEALGLWQLTEVDNSLLYTGRVDYLAISVEPQQDDLLNGNGIYATVLPGRWRRYSVYVPPEATNLMVCVAPDSGPLDVYLRHDADPTLTEFDVFQRIEPPGDCVNLGRRDSPPLTTGRYYIGIFNPGTTPVRFQIKIFIQRGIAANNTFSFRSLGSANILDDAVTNSTIVVSRAQEVAELSVGVRIDHERASDLVLHLISPSGTRILLAENRGGPNATNYGAGVLQTNVFPSTTSGGPAANTNSILVPSREGTLEIAYEFYGVPDYLHVYYDGQLIFDSGVVSGSGVFAVDFGPGLSTNLVIVMNEGDNSNLGTLWTYTATVFSGVLYTTFTEKTNLALVPIKFAVPPFTTPNFAATNIYSTNIGVILDDGFDSAPGGSNPKPLGTIFSGWEVTRSDIDVVYPGYGLCTPSHSPPNGVDLNGQQGGAIATNLTTISGQKYVLSFAYTKNPDRTVVGPRSATVDLSGATNFTFTANPPGSTCAQITWLTTSVVFTATAPQTALTLSSTSAGNGGVFVDSFKVDGGTNYTTNINYGIFYLPEEPLSPFIGEDAFGPWQLEVWDNRAGGNGTNASLLSWKLNITFANTNYATVALTNCTPYTNAVARQSIHYFKFNVPRSARYVTNHLSGSDLLDLLFSYNGPPQGNQPGDFALFNNITDGIAVIATNGTLYLDSAGNVIGNAANPRLVPGRSYYLGVRHNNAGATANIDYQLTVCADRVDPNLGTIPVLVNGVPFCKTVSSIAANTMEYYAFDVVTQAVSVQFGLTPTSPGNLDLYVAKGLPVPTTNYYTAASTNLGNVSEWIDITDQSAYTLGPARWYIGVLNRDPGPISYCLSATQVVSRIIGFPDSLTVASLNAASVAPGDGITNQVSVTANPGEVIYFPINIRNNTQTAWFETFGTNGNVDLFVRPDAAGPLLPAGAAPTNAWYLSTNVVAREFIAVSNTAPVNALVPGTWIIAVANLETFSVPYTVRVTQFTNELPTTMVLTNFVAHPDTLTSSNTVDYYQFTVRSNPVQVVFETFGADGDVDLYVKPFSNVPLPGPSSFALASTNGGATNEYLVTLPWFTNAPASPGIWYLAVVNRTGGAANYQVRARAYYEEDFVTLTNGLPYTNTVAASNGVTAFGFNYFRFVVSTNAFQARFDLYNLSGNADLSVQKGLPLTNEDRFTYQSQNLGTNSDRIMVLTNTTPVALGPGTWYLAVFNQTTNDVAYTINATEILSDQIFRLENGYNYVRTVNPRLTTSLSGIDYYLFQVRSNSFQAEFVIFGPRGNVNLYVKKDLPIADPAGFPLWSTNAGRADEFVVVLTNAASVPLTDGDWYAAVVNEELTNVTYAIRATALTSNEIIRVTNSVPRRRTMPQPGPSVLSVMDHYLFTVSSNALQANFQVTELTGAALLRVRKGLPVTYPWLLSSQNPGTNDEWVVVSTNSTPLALTPGDWYAVVNNSESTPISYTFTASEVLTSQVVTLPTGVLRTTNVAPASPVFALGRDFYAFNVSTGAVQVDCQVFPSGNVDLFVSRNLPLPATPRSDYTNQMPGASAEYLILTTNSAPVALAPGTWYLTVANREPNPTPYSVRVLEMNQSSINRLTNGIAHAATLTASNSIVPYAGIDFHVFKVSSNAVQATFETIQQAGNVDLYVRPGVPLPGPTNYFYAGTNSLTALEWVPVTTNSTPFPLTPGDWFVAVVNRENFSVPYVLRATEVLADQIVTLTNGVAFTNTAPASPTALQLGSDHYRFNAATGAVQAIFETFGARSNVDLYVSYGLPLPDAAHFYYSSARLGATNEWILVTNSATPISLTNGDWFVAVVNRETAPARYAVRATDAHALRLTNGVSYSNLVSVASNSLASGVDYYQFKVSLGAFKAIFETFNASDNVDLYLRRGLPLPGTFMYDYASTNAGTARDLISLTTNSAPLPLTPGDWYLAVLNRSTNQASYQVRVTEFVDTSWLTTLTNGQLSVAALPPGTAAGASGRYFVFNVSTAAVAVSFEAFPSNGNVNLYLSRDLPLPTETDYFYASTNAGTSVEQILVSTDSDPYPLLPGDWYLLITNPETNAVTFGVQVTEFYASPSPAIRLTNGIPYQASLAATNGAGDYYVFAVSSNAQRAQFEVMEPSGDVFLALRQGLPLPDDQSYDYRSDNAGINGELIVIYPSSSPVPLTPGDWYLTVGRRWGGPLTYQVKATEYPVAGTNLAITRTLMATNSLCLTWAGTLPGAHYFVQGRTSLDNPSWMAASPTLTATGAEMTWCLPLTNGIRFFRIAEGLALTP